MVREFEASNQLRHTFFCSRRLGKSYLLCTLALEVGLRKPNQRIKYLTSTTKNVKEYVQPIMYALLETCPPSLRPEYRINDNKWIFKNGSEILLYGTDKDHGEGLRGQYADLAIIDEAGFVDHLDNIIHSILTPMLVERGGRMLLSSTPPPDLQHSFFTYIAEAERRKTLTKRVLTDCPRFTEKQVQIFIEEAGGRDSEVCRREYFCEIIQDETNAIIPEFNDKTETSLVYSKLPELTYVPDTYTALDPGFSDNTAILFGFYDFLTATIYIQQEYVGASQTTKDIADAINSIERRLWLPWRLKQPYKRVLDSDLRLIQDLKQYHQITFKKTEKDLKEAQINALRLLVLNKQIKIHESCVNLINQLKYGQWRTTSSGRREFKRTQQLGHCDAIDALLYLVRNVNRSRNPIPDTPVNWDTQFVWNSPTRMSDKANKLKNLFK